MTTRSKRFISLFLVLCMLFTTAFAEEETADSVWNSIGGWFQQATEDTSQWASQAWSDTSEWVSQAWEDTSSWASQAWYDTSEWATHAWNDISVWTVQAWNDSSKWVSQAWTDSSNWAIDNWDHFIVWVNTIVAGDPYSWIKDVVLDNGVLAYDEYVKIRSFLESDPSLPQIHQYYESTLSRLSLLSADETLLWEMLQQWTDAKGLTIVEASPLFLVYADDNYYLIAYNEKYQALRTYRIDRMERVSYHPDKPRNGMELYTEDQRARYQQYTFGMYGGGDPKVIKLRVHRRAMNAMVDKFGKNIFPKIIDADHFEISVKVVLSPQFYAWVFGLKKYVRIMDEEARAGMVEHLKSVMGMYE